MVVLSTNPPTDTLSEEQLDSHPPFFGFSPAEVAVGMPVTRHPPHRSRCAALPHRAPASGCNAQALRRISPRCLTSAVKRTLQGPPALRPDPVVLHRLPLGQLPSLHGLRRWGLSSAPDVVRSLHRYYGAVRLPASGHHGRAPLGFAVRAWVRWARAEAGPPGFRTTCCRACTGSPTPPGPSPPRPSGGCGVAFRVFGARRPPDRRSISGLHTLPARSPVNASPDPVTGTSA